MASGFSLLSPSFTNPTSATQHDRVSQSFLLDRKKLPEIFIPILSLNWSSEHS
jgi:hypothetical protein